jgi:hypothetical protein
MDSRFRGNDGRAIANCRGTDPLQFAPSAVSFQLFVFG